MGRRFEPAWHIASLGIGLGVALALVGCDWLGSRPIAAPAKQPDERRVLALHPERLVLNVPSGEPCPCPYESTASLHVETRALESEWRWSVTDPAIATVSAKGMVTALATGTAVVTLEAVGTPPASVSLLVVDQGGRASVTLQ